ncbi:hypothetical protein BGX38DRAFT_1167150 [Terfezia claveryi]|nr:hypothetical protein BGX38DRAFT_1167150 [Terfezia claveryi]
MATSLSKITTTELPNLRLPPNSRAQMPNSNPDKLLSDRRVRQNSDSRPKLDDWKGQSHPNSGSAWNVSSRHCYI